MEKRNKRILMSVFGVLICGASVGLFKQAAFGVDPFQVFMGGMDSLVPITFGTLYIIVNLVLLSFSLIFDRHRVGIATFVNLFLLGYVVDFSRYILKTVMPNPGMGARIAFLLVGIFLMCLSSAFYFTADLGVSTYDAISLVIAEKWKVAPFRYCRIISDLVCVVLGSILYLVSGQPLSGLPGVAGAGTVITAFFMGPLIDYFNVHVAQPFLEK